ncbi:hypothetical protein ACVFZR_03110 [Lacticaseibacillus paracasei]
MNSLIHCITRLRFLSEG